jgi:hypothetical protein
MPLKEQSSRADLQPYRHPFAKDSDKARELKQSSRVAPSQGHFQVPYSKATSKRSVTW